MPHQQPREFRVHVPEKSTALLKVTKCSYIDIKQDSMHVLWVELIGNELGRLVPLLIFLVQFILE